ncbi:hypothetical protein D3C78_1988610 [compost metagenome]
MIGGFAMSAQIRGVYAISFVAKRVGQSCIAAAVFRHAMGQQDHRFQWRGGQPLIDEEAAAVTRVQP